MGKFNLNNAIISFIHESFSHKAHQCKNGQLTNVGTCNYPKNMCPPCAHARRVLLTVKKEDKNAAAIHKEVEKKVSAQNQGAHSTYPGQAWRWSHCYSGCQLHWRANKHDEWNAWQIQAGGYRSLWNSQSGLLDGTSEKAVHCAPNLSKWRNSGRGN